MEDIEKDLSEKSSNYRSSKKIAQIFETAKKQLSIPISKPEVYKPLLLIISITCLQHFSGFDFTRKFLLQILAPAKKSEGKVSGEIPNPDPEGENYTAYYFAILINAIRMAANLLMSNFLKRSKVTKH